MKLRTLKSCLFLELINKLKCVFYQRFSEESRNFVFKIVLEHLSKIFVALVVSYVIYLFAFLFTFAISKGISIGQ